MTNEGNSCLYLNVTYCVKSCGTGKSNIADSLSFTHVNNASFSLQVAIIQHTKFLPELQLFFR